MVDERQVAQVMTMLANNYNSPKGQGDDGELSSALTSSLFSAGEGKVRCGAVQCCVLVACLSNNACLGSVEPRSKHSAKEGSAL